ncbi:hypothetical protein SETIT_8G094000v2 [Setaria italica]|uniref:Rx N-terminal domain-containing protein n=1 Tax=Setaria italica TaxID=4555 RepID=A0A368S5W9_SETIT|nr:hypothetical protein SETIT_8G094000v2 [Setaria italica]RCV37836.1 hypothetical protein SETIT_8G094000v2 [Setaria italica]
MEFAFSAARWVVGKALAPVADGFLEAWAASKNLGSEVDGLMTELQDINNPALNDLLLKLRLLAYDADDVLDELDYFRIQDELDGTYHAANEHAGGCARDLLLNARHTGRYVANKFKLSSGSPDATRGARNKQGDDAEGHGCLSGVLCSCGRWAASSSSPPPLTTTTKTHTNHGNNKVGRGRRFLCGAWPSKVPQRRQTAQIPKLKFDRVDISTRMTEIVKKLKPICAKVSTVLNLELIGSKGITTATMELLGTNGVWNMK